MGVGFKKFSFFHSLLDNESLYSKLEIFCCKKKKKKKRDIIVLWLHPMLCEILLPEMNKHTNKQTKRHCCSTAHSERRDWFLNTTIRISSSS